MTIHDTQKQIADTLDAVKDLLLKKNEQYGDSVLDPINLFARHDPIEGIRVRLDDKYSRLARGNDSIESDEDIHLDCIGYHVMALIALRRRATIIPRADNQPLKDLHL